MAIAPWLFPSFLALMLWGVSMFLPKLAIKSLPPLHLSVHSNVTFFLGTGLVMIAGGYHLGGDPRSILLGMSVGVFGGLGQLCFIYAIRQGPMTHGTVVTALYPVVSTLLAFLVLGETLNFRQGAGIFLGICSLILMVMSRDNDAARQ